MAESKDTSDANVSSQQQDTQERATGYVQPEYPLPSEHFAHVPGSQPVQQPEYPTGYEPPMFTPGQPGTTIEIPENGYGGSTYTTPQPVDRATGYEPPMVTPGEPGQVWTPPVGAYESSPTYEVQTTVREGKTYEPTEPYKPPKPYKPPYVFSPDEIEIGVEDKKKLKRPEKVEVWYEDKYFKKARSGRQRGKSDIINDRYGMFPILDGKL